MKSFVVLAAVLACASATPGAVFAGYPYANTLGYSALGYHGLGYTGLGYTGLAGYPYAGYAAAPAVTYAAAPAVVAPAFTKTQYHAQDELGQASHGYAYPGQAAAETRDAAGNVRGSYAYVNPEGKEVRVNYVADQGGFRAESNALPVAPAATLVGPAPVVDTPEVAVAKANHFAAVQEAQARAGRKRRGLAYTYPVAAHGLTYAAHPYAAYGYGYTAAAAPAVTYAAAPAYSYAAAPAYSYAAAPALTYAAAPALREATLTKVVNTPGHAVSYRVD